MNAAHHPQSCASCGEMDCAMKRFLPAADTEGVKTAFILDDRWPEYESLVDTMAGTDDQILSPGLFGKPGIARYRWPGQVNHCGSIATIARHIAMRRVAKKPGGVRQRAYLRHDGQLAQILGRIIDYRARHLVVMQNFLPTLAAMKLLGGRSYDVLMTRYPMGEIHRRLDRLAGERPRQKAAGTISDFRADPAMVKLEEEALAGARAIYTPHHDIASLFGLRGRLLAWHRPDARDYRPGTRTAFLGPTLTRHRPELVQDIARQLDEPLILIGSTLQERNWWQGIAVEHRPMGPGWLDGIGTILHPAAMTNQPRALLLARAAGVTIHAGTGCGLSPEDYIPLSFGKNIGKS